jgi:mevalonate kinase
MTTSLHSLPSSGINLAPKLMKGPLFYSKILLFGEYGIIRDSKGLSIPYNFYNGALKRNEDPSPQAIASNASLNVSLII